MVTAVAIRGRDEAYHFIPNSEVVGPLTAAMYVCDYTSKLQPWSIILAGLRTHQENACTLTSMSEKTLLRRNLKTTLSQAHPRQH
eukprot:1158332-Pelagomonas_calceolata.AAC.3